MDAEPVNDPLATDAHGHAAMHARAAEVRRTRPTHLGGIARFVSLAASHLRPSPFSWRSWERIRSELFL